MILTKMSTIKQYQMAFCAGRCINASNANAGYSSSPSMEDMYNSDVRNFLFLWLSKNRMFTKEYSPKRNEK